MSTPTEFTTGQIAERFGSPRYRIEYVITSRRIKPVRRLGIIRLFDHTAIIQIKAALREIRQLRKVRKQRARRNAEQELAKV